MLPENTEKILKTDEKFWHENAQKFVPKLNMQQIELWHHLANLL